MHSNTFFRGRRYWCNPIKNVIRCKACRRNLKTIGNLVLTFVAALSSQEDDVTDRKHTDVRKRYLNYVLSIAYYCKILRRTCKHV